MQDMSSTVTIYVATMTGTADLVAEEVQAALEDEGVQVELQPMDDLDAGAFAAPGLYVVVSSTYGQGDVPDNGQALADALERERPDLAHVRYGLFALGDMTYARTFCGGGMTFDRILSELGARRVGEPMRHNASSGLLPEDEAADWARAWYESAMAEA